MSTYIVAFSEGLRAISRFTRKDLSARRIRVFLAIAKAGPLTAREVAKATGTPEDSIFEELAALGRVTTSGKAGLRLVVQIPPAAPDLPTRFGLSVRGSMALANLEINIAAEFDTELHPQPCFLS